MNQHKPNPPNHDLSASERNAKWTSQSQNVNQRKQSVSEANELACCTRQTMQALFFCQTGIRRNDAPTLTQTTWHCKLRCLTVWQAFVSESHASIQKLRCWTVWQALYQNVRQRKLSTLAALRWWHLTWFSIIMSQTPIRMLSPQKVHLFPDMFCNLDVPVAPFCTPIIVSNLTWELRDV